MPVFGQEICANGIDDDNDALIDQYDPDCPCQPNATTFYGLCAPACNYIPAADTTGFELTLEWTGTDTVINFTSLFVADMEGDGLSEVVAIRHIDAHFADSNLIYILNGHDGSLKYHPQTLPLHSRNKGIAIADADRDGRAELYYPVAATADTTALRLVCYEYDPAAFGHFTQQWLAPQIVRAGLPFSSLFVVEDFVVNLADFNYDGTPELYIANEIYNALTGECIARGDTNARGSWNIGFETDNHVNAHTLAVDVLPDSACTHCAGLELVAGNQVYSVDVSGGAMQLEVQAPNGLRDGVTAVADYDLDGDLDGIIGTTDSLGAYIYIWDLQTPTQIGATHTVKDSTSLLYHPVGLPTIADFDGDNRPEIAVCGNYVMQIIDDYLVNIGGTNGTLWSISTSDESGQTGIAIFDFNGDGVAEVVYRDESNLRVMNGPSGTNLATIPCGSATGSEYPLVVDVDNDGETEIVCNCSDVSGPPNTRAFPKAFRSAGDPWMPTRSLWNQYAYFTVHVNDDLSIPPQQQLHHIVGNPPLGTSGPLNTFLTQALPFDNAGNPVFPAPNIDLQLDSLDTSACTSTGQLTVVLSLSNAGSWSLPNGLPIAFYTADPELTAIAPFHIDTLTQALAQDSSLQYTVTLDASSLSSPFTVYVVSNDDGSLPTPYDLANDFPVTAIGECDFTNNKASSNAVSCVALTFPLEWLDVAGEWVGEEAYLYWQVAESEENEAFIVERSLDNGESFHPISPSIPASSQSLYTFVDATVFAQAVEPSIYYRIQQFDRDGSMSYSPLIELNRPLTEFRFNLHPNPVTQGIAQASIHSPDLLPFTLLLTDLTGRRLFSRYIHPSTPQTEVTLPLEGLAKGMYMLELQSDAGRFVQRLRVE